MLAREKGSVANADVLASDGSGAVAGELKLGGTLNMAIPCIVALVLRDRARAALRIAFPRRRARLLLARSGEELGTIMRTTLVDGVIVDLGSSGDEANHGLALAREFPSIPFVGIAPLRGADGPLLCDAAKHEFADVVTEGVDDGVLRALMGPVMFSTRFASALREPPPALGLDAPLQRLAWRNVISHGGRPLRTGDLAAALGVTREHLSRSFAAAGAPNLKRVIDLVRLLAAAELSKNPGYDVRDVARVLGFASASHLSSTSQRIVGTKPASLARLRAIDIVDRFSQGRGRSRGACDDSGRTPR